MVLDDGLPIYKNFLKFLSIIKTPLYFDFGYKLSDWGVLKALPILSHKNIINECGFIVDLLEKDWIRLIFYKRSRKIIHILNLIYPLYYILLLIPAGIRQLKIQ